jgi:hypothetical protein
MGAQDCPARGFPCVPWDRVGCYLDRQPHSGTATSVRNVTGHKPRAPKVPWTATHEASRPSASSSLAREFLSSFVGSVPLRTDLTRPRSRDLLRKVHVSHGCHIGTSLIQSRTCHEEFKHVRRFYQDWCLKSIKKRIRACVSRHSQKKHHTEVGPAHDRPSPTHSQLDI